MRRVTNILFWVNSPKPLNGALPSRKCSIKAPAKFKTSVYVLTDIYLQWSKRLCPWLNWIWKVYIYIKQLNFIVLNGSPDGGQIITMPDPLTGQIVPYMIQTNVDPITGQSSQIMIPLQGGVPRGNC